MPDAGAAQPLSRIFFLEQYRALRTEILGKIERVVRLQLVGVTAIPLVVAAGDHYDLTAVVAAAPVITVIFALILLYEQNAIMRAGKFIRTVLEPELRGDAKIAWEEWLERHPENRRPERFFAWSAHLAFSLYYAGGTYLAYESILQEYGARIAVPVLVLYVAAFLAALYLVVRNFMTGTSGPSR